MEDITDSTYNKLVHSATILEQHLSHMSCICNVEGRCLRNKWIYFFEQLGLSVVCGKIINLVNSGDAARPIFILRKVPLRDLRLT